MKMHSHYVGLELNKYRIEVTARRSMNYAASLGDSNPLYFDDERDGGLLAPPMLSVGLTWPVTSNIWDYIGEQDFPTHLLLTQVHYSEHLVFHVPLRPGMRLVIRGKIVAILPHRAGTQIVLRYDANQIDGAPVFSEYIGGLLRGVECADQGRREKDLPVSPQASPSMAPLWEVPQWIDRLASYVYDGCADLHFPIHTSPAFAHQVGLPGIILQGTATLAHATRCLVDRQASGDPQRLKELSCRFSSMVLPGSEIMIRLLAERQDVNGMHLFFDVLNAEGKKAIRDGYARVV